MAEMRATTKQHRHIMSRPPGGWNASTWEKVAPDVELAARDVSALFWARIDAGKMTPEQADLDHWHEVWTRVSKKHKLNYRREVWNE